MRMDILTSSIGGSTELSVLLQVAAAPGTFSAASNYPVDPGEPRSRWPM